VQVHLPISTCVSNCDIIDLILQKIPGVVKVITAKDIIGVNNWFMPGFMPEEVSLGIIKHSVTRRNVVGVIFKFVSNLHLYPEFLVS